MKGEMPLAPVHNGGQEARMSTPFHLPQHPHRAMLHNEIHARPPEAMTAPLAIAHIVMLADAGGREASRAHVAALLRDHHLALPDANTTHLRMDLGAFRIRWELHTEFVSWTFMVPVAADAFGDGFFADDGELVDFGG